ncbi:hypothetical protein [Kutzneria sp. NPDC052558]|uniref:hypothetical protein n=1 Tax=Kutzneria sp. NPDC052558 TaxID=3364121 RepID=UPI0037C7BE6A
MTAIKDRVKSWFTANAEHIAATFLPELDARPAVPGDSYVRLWLAEGFLAKRVSWGTEYFPALHGGVTLAFQGNEATPFTRFTRPDAAQTAPGVYLDYAMTSLVPYTGGPVEVEAALYRASNGGPLETAVTIAGSLASLIGPPLATAATIADKVSTGLSSVLDNTDPVLGVHWTMGSEGGGGQVLRPGHIIVVNAAPAAVPTGLGIIDGRLHGPEGLLTGFDYLVLRVECRKENDQWRFPELERLRKEAMSAYHKGQLDTYKQLRTQAVVQVIKSPDLTELDALRVAKYVQDAIDRVTRLGVNTPNDDNLDPIPPHRLPHREDVEGLSATDLF